MRSGRKLKDRIHLTEQKTGKTKDFPISDTAAKALREYLDSKCRPAAARPRPRRPSRASQAARPPHSETVESGQDFGPEVQA